MYRGVINVAYRLFGFFSGFPNRRFPREVAKRLKEELTQRGSLVFVSAWPEEHERNDSDAAGMHGMFAEYDMPFEKHDVIDTRMEAAYAARLVHEASCLFLMGGYPRLQRELIRDKGLDAAIGSAAAAVLGVSAGAINMAQQALDTKESPIPYQGLRLADITVKPHFNPADKQVVEALRQISFDLPICAMEDESAIFVAGDKITHTGTIHWVSNGEIAPFSEQLLL